MTAQDTSELDPDDFPDECPMCGKDLSLDRRTDIDMLHASRKAFTFEEHASSAHPIRWWIAEKIARVVYKLQQFRS